jgi:hypothetical protein
MIQAYPVKMIDKIDIFLNNFLIIDNSFTALFNFLVLSKFYLIVKFNPCIYFSREAIKFCILNFHLYIINTPKF